MLNSLAESAKLACYNFASLLICESCADEARRQVAVQTQQDRLDLWRAICPPEYQRTSLNHADMPPPSKRDAIFQWQFAPKGLLVHGPTRRCKTRILWLLVRRLILAGHSVKAITANEFEMTCSDAAAHGNSVEWFNSMTRPEVLFIDDLGKERLTDRVEAGLFAVIEHRTSHHRPILMTINARNDAEMQKKFSPDRGAPIVERLCEFCTPIAL